MGGSGGGVESDFEVHGVKIQSIQVSSIHNAKTVCASFSKLQKLPQTVTILSSAG